MRRHTVGGGPDPDTGKNIIIVEDESLPINTVRVECAYSDIEFANLMAMINSSVTVKAVKGHKRHEIHFIVSPAQFDEVVRDFEDPDVTPMTDAELASEIMRAMRKVKPPLPKESGFPMSLSEVFMSKDFQEIAGREITNLNKRKQDAYKALAMIMTHLKQDTWGTDAVLREIECTVKSFRRELITPDQKEFDAFLREIDDAMHSRLAPIKGGSAAQFPLSHK